MGASGIYIDIDGQPVDLDRVSWYTKAPCGCVCGAHVAYSDYGKPALVVATREQSLDELWPTKAERDHKLSQGFTIFADLRSKVTDYMKGTCPHDPKWGVPPLPQVEGYQWAAVYAYGSRSHLKHLVPDIGVENAAERRYEAGDTKPLCGGKGAFWWRTERHALDGKVECKRCVAKAAKEAADA